MSKTVTVNLGGADYVIPMLNMRQQEWVEAIDPLRSDWLVAFLKIAFWRVTPNVRLEDIEATHGEIKEAVAKVLALSGYDLNPVYEAEAQAE